MGRPILERVSIMAVGTFAEPKPTEKDPMAALTAHGVAETLELREQLQQFKNKPVDCAFGALPHRLLGVAGESLILLTGDERTGLAEVPIAFHPFGIGEVEPVRRVEKHDM